jgi:predicted lysophospholipase L1 biosynthesis ABC-type transport system permease subunit
MTPGLAVFLSSIGIYGLMSYVVSRRTDEIGIRMALGAVRENLWWFGIREILFLAAIGVAIGMREAALSPACSSASRVPILPVCLPW